MNATTEATVTSVDDTGAIVDFGGELRRVPWGMLSLVASLGDAGEPEAVLYARLLREARAMAAANAAV